jgi:shikimate dehydrogenase
VINAAVLGSPISHSLSPLLHSLAYEHLGVQARYEAVEVKSGQFQDFLSKTDKNALSLTMPLKEEALSVSHVISDIAQRITSGNTLLLTDGVWSLTSTDVVGFDFSLDMHGVKEIETVVIIGAGATARAAVASVSKIAKSVLVVSRNPDRINAMNQASWADVTYLPWELTEQINIADLVINTTPQNAADYFVRNVKNPRGAFFEVLYNPWPTALSKVWAQSENLVIDGLDLLIHQGISQVEIFAGVAVDRQELYALMRKAALTKLV